MYISFNLFQLLFLISAINGLVWSLLIFVKKQPLRSNIFLAFLLVVMVFGSLKIVLQEKIPYFNHHLPIPLLYQFTIGPMLYLYLKTTFNNNNLFSVRRLWHFVPTLIFDLLLAIFLFSLSLEQYQRLVQKISFLTDILAFLSFSIYISLSFRLIKQYKSSIEGVGNNTTLRWINQVLVFSVLILISWLMYILWVIFLKGELLLGMRAYYPIYLVFCCSIYGLGIAGYYRPEIGLLYLPGKEKKVLMTTTELAIKSDVVLQEISRQHWYRDQNINLQFLAKSLSITANELSYIINTGFNMNFNDFINKLRIEDFKTRLKDPVNNKFNMLGLAYDSGFNSKASFYRAFKKATGLTPAQFYKKNEGTE